jgi:hypothetical protein
MHNASLFAQDECVREDERPGDAPTTRSLCDIRCGELEDSVPQLLESTIAFFANATPMTASPCSFTAVTDPPSPWLSTAAPATTALALPLSVRLNLLIVEEDAGVGIRLGRSTLVLRRGGPAETELPEIGLRNRLGELELIKGGLAAAAAAGELIDPLRWVLGLGLGLCGTVPE